MVSLRSTGHSNTHTVQLDDESYAQLLLMRNAESVKRGKNVKINEMLSVSVREKYDRFSVEIRQNPGMFGKIFGLKVEG